MTRASLGAVVTLALAVGVGLRVAQLDARPMHHDEANQAVKFGALLEHGEYRYDALDHHGPTLYYLALPAAWMRGARSLAALDAPTLRGVTVAFGAATILLLVLLAPAIGRTAVAAGAILMAVSPAMVFYSRMFIQESLLACFTLAFVIALGRVAMHGSPQWWLVAGLAGGLAIATKETAGVVLPSAVMACLIARRTAGPAGRGPASSEIRWLLGAVVLAAGTAALFFSSFLAVPGAVLEPLKGMGTYLERGLAPANHAHPWHYYLGMLGYSSSGGLWWSEGLVLVLAATGGIAAWVRPDHAKPARTFHARYLACAAGLTFAIFSALPYKTPWNVLPFYVCLIAVAGTGVSRLVGAARSPAWRVAIAAAVVLASAHLGWQAWRASITYAADPRNPYVYAQTVPDAVRMAGRIRALAAQHPDGDDMRVSVVAPPDQQWPLPWYLRTMPHVGYWIAPGQAAALEAPVVVSALAHTDALDSALGDRYVSEFYGLRPGVLLTLYVERGLWDRFMAHADEP
ncbi:MAG: TIGR03663 family protein [Vicinamibacteraceae bacterium]|nr:TIGR03663 family protein [Vicinamibacteraceae bacterium]